MSPPGPPELRSALYEGTVVHRRTGADGGPQHRFTYPLAMAYLHLDELQAVADLHPLWRTDGRPAAVHLRRRDLPGDPTWPADEAMRAEAAAHLGRRPAGPVAVLTHPRTWGWQFNPISCGFCFDEDGSVAALVAEVTNTPWQERTVYVVGGPGTHRVVKTMHVSPFLPMDVEYRLRYRAPGDRLSLGIDVVSPGPGDDTPLLRTELSLRRRPMSRQALGRLLWRYPLMTVRVSAGIYRQAAHLRLAGAAVHRHPGRVAPDAGEPGAGSRAGPRPAGEGTAAAVGAGTGTERRP